MKKSVIELIVDFVLGKKYYACIVNRIGTGKCEISSYLYDNKEAVERYKRDMEGNRSFQWVETISFRSRKEYEVNS